MAAQNHGAPPFLVLPAKIPSLLRMILSCHDSVFLGLVAALPRCVSALILLSPIPHLSRQMAHVPSNRPRTVVFQVGLKAGFCPALASSGPVCPGITLLPAYG